MTDLTPEAERWPCPYAGSRRTLGHYRCVPPVEATEDGWKEDVVEAHSREGAVAIYRQYSRPASTDKSSHPVEAKAVDQTACLDTPPSVDDRMKPSHTFSIRCSTCGFYLRESATKEAGQCISCTAKQRAEAIQAEYDKKPSIFKPWEKKTPAYKLATVLFWLAIAFVYYHCAGAVKYGIYNIFGNGQGFEEYQREESDFWDGQYR